MTTVHLAGPSIVISGRIIQRCSVCGEKLCDSKNTMMPMNKDGSVPAFPVWDVGTFVAIDGNFFSSVPPETNPSGTVKIPDGFCIELVED